jgi:hypothetical protein
MRVAKTICLAAGFLLLGMIDLSSAAQASSDCRSGGTPCPPQLAAAEASQPASKSAPRTKTPPNLLAEPHAVGSAGRAASPGKAAAAKSSKTRSKAGVKAKVTTRTATKAKPPAAPQKNRMARGARHQRHLAQAPRPNRHPAQPVRQAQRKVTPLPEIRPHSGPVYESPRVAPGSASGCDETCQYRDWLNRYAAWYRDFGRYYYGAPPAAMAAPGRPVPPPAFYSENRPVPPPQNTRPDQSERDRLDPWHGYNPHNGPGNGY